MAVSEIWRQPGLADFPRERESEPCLMVGHPRDGELPGVRESHMCGQKRSPEAPGIEDLSYPREASMSSDVFIYLFSLLLFGREVDVDVHVCTSAHAPWSVGGSERCAARVRACSRVSRRGSKHLYPTEPSQQPSVPSFINKIVLDLSGTHSFAHGTWQR